MPTPSIRLLIVDDDEDLLFLLKHQLSALGYEVELCLEGKDCVEHLLRHKPQVVFLDLTMNGVDGEDLCNQIKADHRFSDTKVLIMSGNHDIRRIALACRADGFIAKPITPALIRDKLAKVLA
jgi:CheY-like chemotaxis protein